MSTTRKYGGTGLGLALVKQLVEAHGGTVRIESTMGQGTAFIFTLKVGLHGMASFPSPCNRSLTKSHLLFCPI